MSAKKMNVLTVAVTGGDAIATNRLSGKSNTGTYFISSTKDWPTYREFFNKDSPTFYKLDLNRIKIYKSSFKEFFFEKRELYSDKMNSFETTCDSLLSYNNSPEIKFELRINDTRIFLKFENNSNEVEYLLRKIIYSNLTNLIFVRSEQGNTFYLEIDLNFRKEQIESKEMFYDEFD